MNVYVRTVQRVLHSASPCNSSARPGGGQKTGTSETCLLSLSLVTGLHYRRSCHYLERSIVSSPTCCSVATWQHTSTLNYTFASVAGSPLRAITL